MSSGVYGDMVSFFPELLIDVKYFSMPPDIHSGFDKRTDEKTIRVISQDLKKGYFDAEHGVSQVVERPEIWSRIPLKVGNFIEVTDANGEKVIFRLVEPTDWKNEGGMFTYDLQTVSGNTDLQKEDTDVDYSVGRF